MTLAEVPAAPVSLAATLRESKEMVFILMGIALAFTIHFGFGDFVRTESSTPKIRPVASNEVGNSARVRAGEFERAEQRARRLRVLRRERAARRAAAARAAAASSAPRTSPSAASSPPRAASAPASPPASAPAPRAAPSKPRPSPARNAGGGGGGQSFDDSG